MSGKAQDISRRLLASFIILAALLTAVTSCAKTDTAVSDTTAVPEDTTAAETDYPYPEFNFDGKELKFLILRSGDASQDFNDLYVESDTGDKMDSAVFNRNMKVEEKYNVKITVQTSGDAISETVRAVTANEDAYQVVQDKIVFLMNTLATQNYIYDVNKIPNLTLEAPWYSNQLMKDLSINHKTMAIGGDITVCDKLGISAIMFNKDYVDDYKLEDPYTVVTEGRWTLDKLHEWATATSGDLNGDSEIKKEDDRFGIIAEDFYGWFMLCDSGCRIAEKDSNDIPYFTIDTDKAVTSLKKITDLMYSTPARGGDVTYTLQDYVDVFSEGRAFMHANVLSTFAMFRDMETDYGIIPLPKYDETQTDYISSFSPWVSRFIVVPITNKELDMTGAVIDAMSRESTGTVREAYFNVLLNEKIARDQKSIDMLNIVFDTVRPDIGSIYNWGNTWFMYQLFIEGKKDNLISYYETYKPAADKALADTIALFTGASVS
jgi:hypothetical protein